MLRRAISLLAAAALLLTMAAAPASAGNGPPHLAFVVDGEMYRTVGTPTDLSRTRAPAHTFDYLYDLGPDFLAVAAAAPGDTDYNGGRWMRFHVTITGLTEQPQSEEELLAAEDAGLVQIADEPDMLFVCPVIPNA